MSWTYSDEGGRPPLCKIALSSPPFVHGDNYLGLTILRVTDGAVGNITVGRLDWLVGVCTEQPLAGLRTGPHRSLRSVQTRRIGNDGSLVRHADVTVSLELCRQVPERIDGLHTAPR